jgi:hypothetical protein
MLYISSNPNVRIPIPHLYAYAASPEMLSASFMILEYIVSAKFTLSNNDVDIAS